MTDDHGPTVKALRHEKGRLKMVSRESNEPTTASAINDPPETLVKAVAHQITQEWKHPYLPSDEQLAVAAIAAVRQWDREQRAKIDERLAAHARMDSEVLGDLAVDWMVRGYSIARLDANGSMTRIDPKDIAVRPTVDRTAPEPSREPSNPDDYTDPFNMVTKGSTGGLTEWKRG